MTPAQLRQLLALAEVRKARDLARLDALARRSAALDADIAAARAAHLEDHAGAGFDATPPGLQGRRLAWADHRVTEAREGHAALRPDLQNARADATVSLGKHRAIEHLLVKAERDAAARRQTRLDRDRTEDLPDK